jgi:signal transduction histidine kinase
MEKSYEELLAELRDELRNERKEKNALRRELDFRNNIVSSYKQSVRFQENLYNMIKKQKDEQSVFYLTELKKAIDNAEHVNRAKTRFISNTSHEMRTPLTVVSVNVQTALRLLKCSDNGDNAEVHRLLANAQREIMRLSRIVGGMLTLASISENMEKQNIDIATILHGTADTMSLFLSKRGNEHRTESDEELIVFGDADLLTQVLVNLIQNAHSHTENDIIRIHASRSGGIITESHGGDIQIESEQGGGTVVRFTLPVSEGQLGGETQ